MKKEGMTGKETMILFKHENHSCSQVIDIAEIRYVRELQLLRILNLSGNPIQVIPGIYNFLESSLV